MLESAFKNEWEQEPMAQRGAKSSIFYSLNSERFV